MGAWNRFANLWRGRSLERDFDDELRFHLETRIERNLGAGMNRVDAEREALRHVGRLGRAKEGMREARAMVWIEAWGRDLRHGARLWLRQPAVTALAVLTLSLGIGANAVLYSRLYDALMRPLPFPPSDRLVAIVDGFRTTGAFNTNPTVPELLDIRSSTRTLDGVSFFDTRDFQINGGTEPARVFAARVEASLLSLLGARPALGRLFAEGEDRPGRDRVAILTDGLWRANFGGDPAAVGRPIIVNGAPMTIIGVLPPDFAFDYFSPEPIELYVPFPMNDTYMSRTAEFANVRRVVGIGRLKPGNELSVAAVELAALSESLAEAHPGLYRSGSDGRSLGFFMDAVPLQRLVNGRGRSVLLLLTGAAVLVLLLACANTAQFLLARSIERQPEAAIRTALGARHARLVYQFLSESLLLAGAAAVIGVLQAYWLSPAIGAVLPMRPGGDVDSIALVSAVALTFATTLLFGVFPALLFAGGGRNATNGGRTIGPSRLRTRHALVAFEVAISVVFLVAAVLLLQSLRALHRAPDGYSPADVTVMRMRFVPAGTAPGPTGLTYERYLERIAAVPGVHAAAIADAPLSGGAGVEFAIGGRPDDAATLSRQLASYRIVSPDYFAVLQIPLLEGRTFRSSDRTGQPAVAIINEQMAREFWPGQSAIGQQLRSGNGPRAASMTVVGVVGNVRPRWLLAPTPQIYVSYLQQSEPSVAVLIRAAAGARLSMPAVKQAIRDVAPQQPVFDIRSMDAIVALPLTQPGMVTRLLTMFALTALILSTMGIYTIVVYLTSRRFKEIAVRRAMGATSSNIMGLLAGPTASWTLAGLAAGVVGAVAIAGTLRATILRTAAIDPVTVGLIAVIYVAIVAPAVLIPAAKALRLDPSAVLRTE